MPRKVVLGLVLLLAVGALLLLLAPEEGAPGALTRRRTSPAPIATPRQVPSAPVPLEPTPAATPEPASGLEGTAPPPAGGVTPEAPGTPLPTGSIAGSVRDDRGGPLRMGKVECQVGSKSLACEVVDGKFALADVPAGEAELRASAPGRVPQRIPVGTARRTDLVFMLAPARRVPVWAFSAETLQGVAPYRLEARGPGQYLERLVVDDPSGMTTLDAPLDPITIRIFAEGYVGWQGDDAAASRVKLERGLTVKGLVLAGERELRGAGTKRCVRVVGAAHSWAPQTGDLDAEGGFQVTGIAPDEAFAVLVWLPRHGRASAVEMKWNTPGTTEVRVPTWRTGRIALHSGPPDGPVDVVAISLPEELRPSARPVANPEGKARFDGLPPGTWAVRWKGTVVGTIELPLQDSPEFQGPWPGDPAAVRAAWEARRKPR